MRLKYAYNFTCTRLETDATNGRVTRVFGTLDWDAAAKPPKGILSWVPADAPTLEVRVYSHLFTVPELPAAVADWESFVDTMHSEVVYPHARVDSGAFATSLVDLAAGKSDAVQFERIGYFVADADSTATRKVLNQIIPLREASSLVAATAGSVDATGSAKADASRKDAQQAQLALKLERMKLSPRDMFTAQRDLYSAFDGEGLPTHDAAGVLLTKNQVKKLKKDQEKQKKLHDAYLAQL